MPTANTSMQPTALLTSTITSLQQRIDTLSHGDVAVNDPFLRTVRTDAASRLSDSSAVMRRAVLEAVQHDGAPAGLASSAWDVFNAATDTSTALRAPADLSSTSVTELLKRGISQAQDGLALLARTGIR